MRYNVAQLLKEPVGSTRHYQLDERFSTAEADLPERAKGYILLMRTDKGIWVTARLDTLVPCICSRCLKPVQQSMDITIEEEFFPTVDIHDGRPLPLPADEDEGSFTIDRNHVLDLGEAMREYYIASGPMKPLCKPRCLGLCPSCGGDLNRGECTCKAAAGDPRWAPLKRLLEKDG